MRDWREVHGALMAIVGKRAGLDADEARWLREAEAVQIWRSFGMVSALDYLERKLGYAPRTAQERLRVARWLGELPALEAALARGELAYSAVKELSRVATRDTESEWLDAAACKSLRSIEDLVAGKQRGDRPGDPARPEMRPRTVTLELTPEAYARWREARAQLADEHGHRLDDSALVSVLCDAALSTRSRDDGRAKFEIAVTVCGDCDRAWQDGGGRAIEIDAAALARARCDARHVGYGSARATQTIPPATMRLVWRRDHGACRVPGCRSARGLEVHHLVHRADGGSHDPSNLVLLCSACHLAHHRGDLALSGDAAHLAVARPGDPDRAHVGAPPGVAPARRDDAITGLVGLGFPPPIARTAVDAALQREPDAPLELLLRAALRECPRPRAA